MAGIQLQVRIFIAFVCALGIACLVGGAFSWHNADLVEFTCYLILTAVASGLKATLPGLEATVSVSSVFFLLAICNMGWPQALALGVTAAVVQCYWKASNKLQFVHFAFNLSQVCVAITAAYWTYTGLTNSILRGRTLIALLPAVIVYFLTNTIPVATVVSLIERKSPLVKWKEAYAWTFPHYLIGAAIAGIIELLNGIAGWQLAVLVLPALYAVYRSYCVYIGRFEEENKHLEEMAALHLRTVEALALAIEAKDHTTGDHLQRVRIYALELAKDLNLTPAETAALRAAAVLHDIGKLAVPEHIISKPGKLTPEEFEKMKVHPIVGAEILDQVRFPYPVGPIVRSHHEKWDGSGYPDGLSGEAIPIGARILAAVDCLDALASDRQYRKALPLDEAMAKVEAEAGKSFDPRVVAALKARYIELEQMAHSQQPEEKPKLSIGMRVTRGAAPAAGFAEPEPSPQTVTDAREGSLTAEIADVSHTRNHLSLNEALSSVAMRLRHGVAFDAMAVFLVEGELLMPCFVMGENSHSLAGLHVQRGQGLVGWVAETRNSIVNGNPSVEPGYIDSPATLASALAVPLIAGGKPLGVLVLYHRKPSAFTSDHLRAIELCRYEIADTIGTCLDLKARQSLGAMMFVPTASSEQPAELVSTH